MIRCWSCSKLFQIPPQSIGVETILMPYLSHSVSHPPGINKNFTCTSPLRCKVHEFWAYLHPTCNAKVYSCHLPHYRSSLSLIDITHRHTVAPNETASVSPEAGCIDRCRLIDWDSEQTKLFVRSRKRRGREDSLRAIYDSVTFSNPGNACTGQTFPDTRRRA